MGKGELRQSTAASEGIDTELFQRCTLFSKSFEQTDPVQQAIMTGDVAAVRAAADRGFDLQTDWGLPDPNRTTVETLQTRPVTSVELAAAFGQGGMVAYLLQQRVTGPNALYWALRKGWFDMVYQLIATHQFKLSRDEHPNDGRSRFGLIPKWEIDRRDAVAKSVIANPPPNWNKSQRFALVKLLSTDHDQLKYAMGDVDWSRLQKNFESDGNELRFIQRLLDLTSKYETPAEKAAAIFLYETKERSWNPHNNNRSLEDAAAGYLLKQEQPGSLTQRVLQSSTIQSTFMVKHHALSLEFSGMQPAAIMQKVIDDLRKEYTDLTEREQMRYDEIYFETRLGLLENYLRAFVFNEPMSDVYPEMTVAERKNLNEVIGPYFDVRYYGPGFTIWKSGPEHNLNSKARRLTRRRTGDYESSLYGTAATAASKPTSASASADNAASPVFTPSAPPVSVTWVSQAAATSTAAAEPQPPSAPAAQPKTSTATPVGNRADLIDFSEPAETTTDPTPVSSTPPEPALDSKSADLIDLITELPAAPTEEPKPAAPSPAEQQVAELKEKLFALNLWTQQRDAQQQQSATADSGPSRGAPSACKMKTGLSS